MKQVMHTSLMKWNSFPITHPRLVAILVVLLQTAFDRYLAESVKTSIVTLNRQSQPSKHPYSLFPTCILAMIRSTILLSYNSHHQFCNVRSIPSSGVHPRWK